MDLHFVGMANVFVYYPYLKKARSAQHNFKTIAVTMVPAVEEILTEFLLGQAAKSIPRKYASAVFVTKSRALREAQRQIARASSIC